MIESIIFFIAIIAIVAEYFLHRVSDFLDLSRVHLGLPEKMKPFADELQYARTRDYLVVNKKFGLITSSFQTVLILLMLFAGAFDVIDQWLRGFGYADLSTGLLFFGVIFFANEIISLPFAWHRTFKIESKFGFNRSTPKVFIFDTVKSWFLTIILGGPLSALIFWFFGKFGATAWLYVWGIFVLLIVLMPRIATTFIMPLFNKFSPLEDGDLKDGIFEIANRADFPLQKIFVMDGSKRSTHSNAFMLGFGKKKRIVLYDTLIEQHSVEEIQAILAHEIGHDKKRHGLQGGILSALNSGIMLYLLGLMVNNSNLSSAFGMETHSIYAAILFFGLLFAPISMLLNYLMNIISRKNEFAADRFAVQLTQKPEVFIRSLAVLHAKNLAFLHPHPFTVAMFYSHPTLLERMEVVGG